MSVSPQQQQPGFSTHVSSASHAIVAALSAPSSPEAIVVSGGGKVPRGRQGASEEESSLLVNSLVYVSAGQS